MFVFNYIYYLYSVEKKSITILSYAGEGIIVWYLTSYVIGVIMDLINKFERVAQLFKPTFCRDFIVYGSNLICCNGNCAELARMHNESMYDEVELLFNIDDTLAANLNPAYRYAFDCIYTVDKFKFYMCSYWQFMVILAANEAYRLNHYFRYPTNVDLLNSYMYCNRCGSDLLYKYCTLLFGDVLNLMNRVGVIVDSIKSVDEVTIDSWLTNRWLLLQDLPRDVLAHKSSHMKELGLQLRDLSFLSKQFSAYTMEIGTIHDAIEIYDNAVDQFHEYISQLSE